MLLDAFGTLVTMEPPAPRLRAALAADGHQHGADACERAIAAEIAHYRRHHLRGADARSLTALRRECAGVLAAELGPDTPGPERMTELLLDALQFRPAPGARECLRSLAGSGFRLAVVSNWDVSLAVTLRALDLHDPLDVVVTSAGVGHAKPHPAPFAAALAELRARPEHAIHCGDSAREDGHGARNAGVRAVRVGAPGAAPGAAIGSLDELPSLAERLLSR